MTPLRYILRSTLWMLLALLLCAGCQHSRHLAPEFVDKEGYRVREGTVHPAGSVRYIERDGRYHVQIYHAMGTGGAHSWSGCEMDLLSGQALQYYLTYYPEGFPEKYLE
jgi:hypothetical protein